eukprot:CAMPEP_0197493404 /NCGR_PEP_ID=MMETSP1311-20131121/21592_1 /TAXON_ID=464262 /ORGANISM="Genus nov. species nov., Strain RCC856" /LENGTH=76 /DNA_ID=CAMNT_0043038635 /DNA_START=384 /DNA_END=611 /DNA_ORIENTATION=+
MWGLQESVLQARPPLRKRRRLTLKRGRNQATNKGDEDVKKDVGAEAVAGVGDGMARPPAAADLRGLAPPPPGAGPP